MAIHSHNTCLTDCQELISLANDIVTLRPAFKQNAKSWFATARQLCTDRGLNTYQGERRLEDLALELRDLWLKSSLDITLAILKSPPHQQKNYLPSGKQVWFDYERAFKPETLEKKLMATVDCPQDWQCRPIVFSSAMGALSTISQVFGARLDGVAPDQPVRMGMLGGYFETWRMLNFLHDRDFEVVHLNDNADTRASIMQGDLDILFIEPVSYDWDMEVFDIEPFHGAYAQAGQQAPRLVIIDTTLVGIRFPISEFLKGFNHARPWIVLCVRSGLKLDQQGLETTNVGIVEIYVPSGKKSPANVNEAHFKLMVARAVFGAGVSVNDAGALEAPWITDREKMWSFSEQVFRNNHDLATGIKLNGGIFTKIAHPALDVNARRNKGAVAPFVMLHLPRSQQRSFGYLVAILLFEIEARGLNWQMGSSFGFRGHRFEVIKANVQVRPNAEQYGMLKVAMGSRGGPSVVGILELINDIARHANWQSLKTNYSQVKPFVTGKAGLFVARPSRSG